LLQRSKHPPKATLDFFKSKIKYVILL
jgi:hypothetical protein